METICYYTVVFIKPNELFEIKFKFRVQEKVVFHPWCQKNPWIFFYPSPQHFILTLTKSTSADAQLCLFRWKPKQIIKFQYYLQEKQLNFSGDNVL